MRRRRPSTAEAFAGTTPARHGWRFDPIWEIGGVLQVGGFDAATQATAPAECHTERAELCSRIARVIGGGEGLATGPHAVPSPECHCGTYFCGWHDPFTTTTMFPQISPFAPLRGYAVTEVEAVGEVLGSRVRNDPMESWRATALEIAGPIWLDLHNPDDFEPLRERYPTARLEWFKVEHPPRAEVKLWGAVMPPSDAMLRGGLQRIVEHGVPGRLSAGERHMLTSIVTAVHKRYAGTEGPGRELWAQAWAVGDAFINGRHFERLTGAVPATAPVGSQAVQGVQLTRTEQWSWWIPGM